MKGSYHIRIKEQTSNRSWLLFIGAVLDREIGRPVRVLVIRRGNIVHIAPTEEHGAGIYTVVRPSGGGMARISIGRHICTDELGLFGGINRQCRVENGEIKVFV